VAFVLFSIFYVVFIASQGDNILDSQYVAEELKLHNLCENILNDILVAPPVLNDSLTNTPQVKKFEDSELADYDYMIEYKRFEIPNIFQINNEEESEEEQEEQNNSNNQYLGLIFEQIKNNIKEAIWQIQVTVKNKQNNTIFTLSSWLRNPDARIQTQFAPGGGAANNSNSTQDTEEE
jgi:hypothetical protein